MASFLQLRMRSTIVKSSSVSPSTVSSPMTILSTLSSSCGANLDLLCGRAVAVEELGRFGEREIVERFDWRRNPRSCDCESPLVLSSSSRAGGAGDFPFALFTFGKVGPEASWSPEVEKESDVELGPAFPEGPLAAWRVRRGIDIVPLFSILSRCRSSAVAQHTQRAIRRKNGEEMGEKCTRQRNATDFRNWVADDPLRLNDSYWLHYTVQPHCIPPPQICSVRSMSISCFGTLYDSPFE